MNLWIKDLPRVLVVSDFGLQIHKGLEPSKMGLMSPAKEWGTALALTLLTQRLLLHSIPLPP